MKNIVCLLTIGSAFALASCGPKKSDDVKAPQGYQIVDLNPYGFSATILVPDSTAINQPLEIKQIAGVEIKRGKGFDIIINTGDGEVVDLVKQKSFIEHEEPKKVKRWILDEKDAVMYEQQIFDLKPEVHMYCIMQIGNEKYAVIDNHESEDPYKEESVKMMMKAAKSMQFKEPPPNPKKN